jgi:hypothetical protein
MIAFVVFTQGEKEHWWSFFTHKKFRHCYLLTPIDFEGRKYTLLLDARVNYLQNVVYTNNINEILKSKTGISEVYLVSLANSTSKRYIIEVRTCVTLIKLALNVTWPWVQTPKALRDKLCKQKNATRVR